jgi:hypothetical protein
VNNPGWLPDLEVFPELVEARSELLRLREAWVSTGAKASALERELDRDADRRRLDLRDAYLAGDDATLASASKRLTAELQEAEAQAQAAAMAWLEHVNRCVALVIERRHAWFGSIDQYKAEIDGEVQELMEQAAKLRTRRDNFARFEHWAERTGGPVRPGGVSFSGAEDAFAHFPYSDIEAPASGDARDEEERMTAWFMKSFAGFDGKNLPLSDEQGRALEQANAASRGRDPERDLDLSEMEDSEIVDWLMSCGQFDGRPKPGADFVVAAAEDNPEMARRLLKAERVANEAAPRPAVVNRLSQIAVA